MAALAWAARSAIAAEGEATSTDSSLTPIESIPLEQLLEVAIASRKRESTALAPAMVSVIDKEHLERIGARRLYEALRGVVGFDVRRGEKNDWVVALRGYDTAANMLLMLDGQRMNDPYDGSVPWDFPLENVERIEIIRGPGSAIYGSNAFVGVINLITFAEEEKTSARAWLGVNDDEQKSLYQLSQPEAGVAIRGGTTLGALKVDAHAMFREDKGDALLVPSDHASLANAPWSLARCVDSAGQPLADSTGAPILRLAKCQAANGRWNGVTNDAVRHADGSLRLRLGELEWLTRVGYDSRGGGLSDLDMLNLTLANQSRTSELALFSQASYTLEIDDTHSVRFRLLYDQRGHDDLRGLAPAGYVNQGVTFADGQSLDFSYVSRDLGAEVISDKDVSLGDGWAGILGLNVGAAVDRRQVDSASLKANFTADGLQPQAFADASGRLPALYYEDTSTPRPECSGGRICVNNRSAEIISGWVQGRWTPKPAGGVQAVAIAGLRADYDTEVGFIPSPRAGFTLVADDATMPIDSGLVKALIPDNFKLLFGQAFRSPTFKERFDNIGQAFSGNPSLVAERIASLEAGLGYRFDPVSLFANAFYSDITDSIQRLYTGGLEPLRQRASRQVQGIEFEARTSVWRFTELFANLAYLLGTDTGPVPGSNGNVITHLEDQPALKANAGVEVQIIDGLFAGFWANYTGSRENLQRTPSEASHRFTTDPQLWLDASLRWKELAPGLMLQLFVHNLLDQRYRDPLAVYHESDVKLSGADVTSYLLPREGLTLGLEAVYRFDSPDEGRTP
jgi:iron complex outermembrane receptor protein